MGPTTSAEIILFEDIKKNKTSKYDVVHKPKHYNQGKIEVWDLMELALSDEEFRGYLKGNQIKYLLRYKHKGKVEDLKKLRAYNKRLEEFESGKRVRWYYENVKEV